MNIVYDMLCYIRMLYFCNIQYININKLNAYLLATI